MILAIDIGNTNVKCGVFDGDKLLSSFRLSSSVNKTSDEYGMTMMELLKERSVERSMIDGVIMSSVNPNMNYTFEHLIRYYFGRKPLVVGAGLKTGLNIKYDNPKEVGADRIVGSVAAYYTYGGPCIVMDCGTATTFNAINGKGEFLGGAIGFGLKTGSDALTRSASKLPKVELSIPESAIGKTTITNMQSGLIFGYVGMVEYLISRIKSEMKCDKIKVVATGGLSEIVASQSSTLDIVDSTLTLRGLNIIYGLNRDSRDTKVQGGLS